MIRLGVNIDHVATLRNARGEKHPEYLKSAKKAYKIWSTFYNNSS